MMFICYTAQETDFKSVPVFECVDNTSVTQTCHRWSEAKTTRFAHTRFKNISYQSCTGSHPQCIPYMAKCLWTPDYHTYIMLVEHSNSKP